MNVPLKDPTVARIARELGLGDPEDAAPPPEEVSAATGGTLTNTVLLEGEDHETLLEIPAHEAIATVRIRVRGVDGDRGGRVCAIVDRVVFDCTSDVVFQLDATDGHTIDVMLFPVFEDADTGTSVSNSGHRTGVSASVSWLPQTITPKLVKSGLVQLVSSRIGRTTPVPDGATHATAFVTFLGDAARDERPEAFLELLNAESSVLYSAPAHVSAPVVLGACSYRIRSNVTCRAVVVFDVLVG